MNTTKRSKFLYGQDFLNDDMTSRQRFIYIIFTLSLITKIDGNRIRMQRIACLSRYSNSGFY